MPYLDLSDILSVSCLLSLGEDDLSYFRLEPFPLDTSRFVDLSRFRVFSDLADFLWFFLRFRSDSFFTLDLNIFIFFSFPRISLKQYFNVNHVNFTTQEKMVTWLWLWNGIYNFDDWMKQIFEQMNKNIILLYLNGQMNKWSNEWMNEWTNEKIIELKDE